jgi:predicted CopG family antitoxin
MALKFKGAARDDIPEEQRALYVERDGVWLLDVDGAVEKAKLDEFRANNTALPRQLDEHKKRFASVVQASRLTFAITCRSLARHARGTGHCRLVDSANFCQISGMATKTIDPEADAVERLETAKWTPEESYSDVVRRARFPQKPHLARELLEEFHQRAGHSPLTEEALDRLAEAQRNPAHSPSHWD